MNENQAERLVCAFESIAKYLEKWYNAEHPTITKVAKEPTITFVKTSEEQLLEDQGQTGEETTEEWTSLGPIEREFLSNERKK